MTRAKPHCLVIALLLAKMLIETSSECNGLRAQPYFVLLLTRRDTVVLPPPPDRWEFQLFANTQMGEPLSYLLL